MGREFQLATERWFKENYNLPFELEKKIPIGKPAKLHRFDIAAQNESVVIECKYYTWTETGNVPNAKIHTLNEAAFYLSFLPDTTEKIIVILHAEHPKRNESLTEYYFRINRHLLGKIKIYEYDMQTKNMHFVGQNED